MAIKKPITKKTVREEEAPAKKSLLKKRPREVEEEEEEADVEEEEPEEEEEAPKKKGLKSKKAPVEEEEEEAEPEEEEEAPAPRKGSSLKKKKSKSKQSLADIFDSTKPGRGVFPVGDFNAKVTFELVGEIADDPDDQEELKVVAAFIGFGNDDDEVDEKKIGRQQYILWTEDGEAGPGIPWLKGDLDVLGYEDVTLEDLEDIFSDIEGEEPVVVIKNKESKGYVNSYIQGLAEEA